MNVNILHYSLFGIAGGQEVDHTFVKFIIYPLTMIANLIRVELYHVVKFLTKCKRSHKQELHVLVMTLDVCRLLLLELT